MSDKKTILLVEDDEFLIDILVQKFNEQDYNLLHVNNGEDAIQTAQEKDPDIILLDIILPGMNGFEVLKKLKNNTVTDHIPVVFLSNLGQEEDIEKGKKLGAVDFIVKANHSLDEIVERTGEILSEDA